jgi:hypothetical protein
MPRELESAHADLIASGHCGEITVLDLILMAGAPLPFTADASTDALTSAAHGIADGAAVILRTSPGFFLPKPLQPETVYYVRDAATNTLKLSETQGGSAVNITWAGSGAMTITPVSVVPLAVAEVSIDGVLYGAHLHPTEGLKLTKTASLDRFGVRVQNADKAMGLAVTGIDDALAGALATVGTVHEDLEGSDAYYDPRLPGLVVGCRVDEATADVSFTVVSDIDEAEYAGDLLTAFFPASDPPASENHGVVNDLPIFTPREPTPVTPWDGPGRPGRLPDMESPFMV